MDRLLERERELAAVEGLLRHGGAVLVVEGGAGLGKTSLLNAAARRASGLGHEVLRARGSELEAGFAFGVARQLFERRIALAGPVEREALLAGAADAVRSLLLGEHVAEASATDTSFAVLHGLYWLTANLAARRPLLVAVDDAHWADEPSLRWLAHLAPRLAGLPVALIVALRPLESRAATPTATTLRAAATDVVRPAPLSGAAVAAVVRDAVGSVASDEVCAAAWSATGGNPFYLAELLRAAEPADRPAAAIDAAALLAGGRDAIGRRVVARARAVDPHALAVAQAVAVLGEGCELRHAARIAGTRVRDAMRLAAGLVRAEILGDDDPPRFIHPVVREAIEASLPGDERDAAHRAAARLLHADGAAAGRVAAHLARVRPAGDRWVADRLRAAARAAVESGAPAAAAALLERALAEPPPRAHRVAVLRETARAEAGAGRASACATLEHALGLTEDPRERAEIALELAEAFAALFRWVDAVDVIDRALAELGDADDALAARLEGELVVCGLHDARRAARVPAVLRRLAARRSAGAPAEARAVAEGMAMVLAGRPAEEAAGPPEQALRRSRGEAENWDTRAALLWSLLTAERYGAVAEALRPTLAAVHRSGSARGLVAAYSTLALLELRLGALPEADAAARVALRVLREGDFAPGLAFAATVLADVAVEAGDLDEAQALLDLLPRDGWPPGVGTVLIPAARGRLRLAQGDAAAALEDFRRCSAMFSAELWGTEMRDVGYLHARSGAALALLRLGDRAAALALARAELADVRAFGAPRALGVALRAAGLAEGGDGGRRLLAESAAVLRTSPAALDRAHSLAAARARSPLARARSSSPPARALAGRGGPASRR